MVKLSFFLFLVRSWDFIYSNFLYCLQNLQQRTVSLISIRALIREWTENISFKNSYLIAAVSDWEKSDIVMQYGLSLIMGHRQDYESGDEEYKEILAKRKEKAPKNPMGRGPKLKLRKFTRCSRQFSFPIHKYIPYKWMEII